MTRYLAALVLLAATAGYVALHPPANLAAGRGVLRGCPATLGAWNGTELSFEDAVLDELQADDVLIRRYQRATRPVWLCVIYHQNRRYGAHDPLLCYESQGYAVEQEGRVRVDDGSDPGLEANRFVAERRRDRRLVYYWWTTAGLTTADAGAFRRRMALAGALENRSWGAFVRVETLMDPGEDARAEADLADFSSQVARRLPAVFAAGAAASARPR
jgi:EpsI family protein